jgi:hypothetical protein
MLAGAQAANAATAIVALRADDNSIEVDGMATEAAWSTAHWYDEFVQRDPKEGALPSERTRVAVIYDSRAIFIFVRSEDSKADRIFASLTRRDRASPSDWVEVWLAPQRDRRSGYRFAVNARGVQMDARLGEGGETQDFEWNGVWTSKVLRDDKGWSAEIEIPFSEMTVVASTSTFLVLGIGATMKATSEWAQRSLFARAPLARSPYRLRHVTSAPSTIFNMSTEMTRTQSYSEDFCALRGL